MLKKKIKDLTSGEMVKICNKQPEHCDLEVWGCGCPLFVGNSHCALCDKRKLTEEQLNKEVEVPEE